MIWNRPMECADRETMRALQLKKLQATVKRVYQNVEPYRLRMQEKGIKPGDIQSLDDLKYLPFTTKADLRDNYPYGMFSAPLSEIVRIHASSGTTGKPTVVGYTRNDLEMWNECVTRALCMAGAASILWFRWPMDTACSPEGWGPTVGRSISAHRLSL